VSSEVRILVTGGAGFLGSHVVERLLARGHHVEVLDDLSTGHLANLERARDRFGERLEVRIGDVVTDELLASASRGRWDAIVHLAARASLRASSLDPFEDARVNVLGTVRVIQAATAAKVRKVVFAASAAIYGDPPASELPLREERALTAVSFYGASKVAGVAYLDAARVVASVRATSLVFANLYGPRQRPDGGAVVARFLEAIAEGSPPTVFGDGSQTRDFVWVGDAAEAVVAALDHADGLLVNVATGTETSIASLARLATQVAGRPELAPVHQGRQSQGEVRRSALDPSRAARVLGWRPRLPLAEGLARTWEAVRSRVEA